MADPNEAPSPAELREMAARAERFFSFDSPAHQHAANKIILALRACATALEAKDREIARLDPMRSLKCPHGWLSWECSECIRAYGKEPKP